MQRILLIEDDKSIRTVIALQLRIRGHQVEVAEDGEEGIELFTRFVNFDLVITDIRMPRKDGNGVAKYIRSSERVETRILAMTAYNNEVQTDLFDFIIIKPFRIEDLIRVVDSLETGHSGKTTKVPDANRRGTIETYSVFEKS